MTSEPRDVLVEIVAKYGDPLLSTPGRCEGLLKDYCGEHRREISALMTCLRSGTVAQLRQQNGTPIKEVCSRLTLATLDRNPAICSDIALWAMESWAVALGLLDADEATAPMTDPVAPSISDSHEEEPAPAPIEGAPVTSKPESVLEEPRPDFLAQVFIPSWPVPDWSLSDKQVTVYPDSSGQKPTLREASKNAPDNTCLILKPGLYKESVTIKRNLQIRADGEPGEIIMESASAPVLIIDGAALFITGVTLKGLAGKERKTVPAVDVKSGHLAMEYCDLTSEVSTIMEVKGARSEVILRQCHLHDGKAGGIVFQESAVGYLEECHFYQNKLSHIVIGKDCSPTLFGCKISAGLMAGVYINDGGAGLIENCDIWGNAVAGIQCQRKGKPTVRHCRISLNQRYGVLVTERGEGLFEECQMFDNDRSGVTVSQQSRPTFSNCKMFDNRADGIEISEQSAGEFLECEAFNNDGPNVSMKDKSTTVFRDCQIHDGRNHGILLTGAEGLFEQCAIYSNAQSGLMATQQAKPVVQGCKFYDGKANGITLENGAEGQFTDCSVINHAGNGVMAGEKAQARFEKCEVRDNTGGDWNIASSARVKR